MSLIPDRRKEFYTRDTLPKADVILRALYQKEELDKNIKPGEIERAKSDHKKFIGLANLEIEKLVDDCIDEMDTYETISREPPEERLRKIRLIAHDTDLVVVYSAPGDYYHDRKKDRYQNDPAMVAADRLRDDQAAILAIVIAGIRENWSDHDLLLFLEKHVLTNDDPILNNLKEDARQAVAKHKIRIVYTGREDEVAVVERIRKKKNLFIPGECIDILPPENIDNTVDQTKELGAYLKKNLAKGEKFIVPMNLQGGRSMRMANEFGMIPEHTHAIVFAMPTMVGPDAINYRTGEIKGTVYRVLTGDASFEPAPHIII
ncbi:hypothetical protein COY16_04140 [Candidatus Roizmanbacteria bacterium CG_4_10_14_0_2_um_filter_39_13]|uniref:Uncharacterized protein n=1 Tax=Candidatus Roizmanbacteria bacterium CG_4_10_14_0_2_um_filter_39_13 TaxID=1974825 RepID=A0A2M7TXC5_9BACT|nr:MAG: hypothetical protein COY16_04140 [Candidatus Roizmanbacteria bacterium CG_4_10_14_0_2_um_filter_39_13]